MKQFSFSNATVLLLLTCALDPVAAQTASEKMDICDKAGDFAAATVVSRDAGIPVEKSQALVATFGIEGNVKAMFNALVALTYVMDGVEGPVMKQVAVQMCQKSMGLK